MLLRRIHPAYLAWALDELVAGHVISRVTVDQETARYARIALERMLTVVGPGMVIRTPPTISQDQL